LDFEITTKIFIYKFISISILFYIDDVTRLEGKSLNDGVQSFLNRSARLRSSKQALRKHFY